MTIPIVRYLDYHLAGFGLGGHCPQCRSHDSGSGIPPWVLSMSSCELRSSTSSSRALSEALRTVTCLRYRSSSWVRAATLCLKAFVSRSPSSSSSFTCAPRQRLSPRTRCLTYALVHILTVGATTREKGGRDSAVRACLMGLNQPVTTCH